MKLLDLGVEVLAVFPLDEGMCLPGTRLLGLFVEGDLVRGGRFGRCAAGAGDLYLLFLVWLRVLKGLCGVDTLIRRFWLISALSWWGVMGSREVGRLTLVVLERGGGRGPCWLADTVFDGRDHRVVIHVLQTWRIRATKLRSTFLDLP